MRKKLKPDLDLDMVKEEVIESVCSLYTEGISVRSLAKKTGISPMKVRKILLTGGKYTSDMSAAVNEMYQEGKTVGEIAAALKTIAANVHSYLPYERIIYNMNEKSVAADRQKRYQDRKSRRCLNRRIKEKNTDLLYKLHLTLTGRISVLHGSYSEYAQYSLIQPKSVYEP